QPRQPPQGDGRRDVEVADASRRTRLANERTYLAWWRTGLASLAVGLGVGKVVPLLTSGRTWPYTVAGVGFAALGITFIVLALVRQRQVERAISRGEFAPPDEQLVLGLTLVGALFGLLLLVLLITSS